MARFIATAEHCNGAWVKNDPTDQWQIEVEGETLEACNRLAQSDLENEVALHEEAGSHRWWNSVAISLWPIDEAAARLIAADGGDLSNDPYQLIPAELKTALCRAICQYDLKSDAKPWIAADFVREKHGDDELADLIAEEEGLICD